MSGERDDGGPVVQLLGIGDRVKAIAGLSLRDYFAAHALIGVIGWNGAPVGPDETQALDLSAETAFAFADAMLRKRSP
jgi:hypothetical protein